MDSSKSKSVQNVERVNMKLLNAFSANMIANFPASVKFKEVSVEDAVSELSENLDSAVGHADTAAVFSNLLGLKVETKRQTVELAQGESAILGQYSGPRLQEGATELPDGANIVWLKVEVA